MQQICVPLCPSLLEDHKSKRLLHGVRTVSYCQAVHTVGHVASELAQSTRLVHVSGSIPHTWPCLPGICLRPAFLQLYSAVQHFSRLLKAPFFCLLSGFRCCFAPALRQLSTSFVLWLRYSFGTALCQLCSLASLQLCSSFVPTLFSGFATGSLQLCASFFLWLCYSFATALCQLCSSSVPALLSGLATALVLQLCASFPLWLEYSFAPALCQLCSLL